jgi:hypothetical protein
MRLANLEGSEWMIMRQTTWAFHHYVYVNEHIYTGRDGIGMHMAFWAVFY